MHATAPRRVRPIDLAALARHTNPAAQSEGEDLKAVKVEAVSPGCRTPLVQSPL